MTLISIKEIVQSYDSNRKIDETLREKEQNEEKITLSQSPGSNGTQV